MRDTWFVLSTGDSTQTPRHKHTSENYAVVWSWDYDGASDVLRTRRPHPGPVETGNAWPRVKSTSLLPVEEPNPFRLQEFWRTMMHSSGSESPSLVMSGSARIVYQTPGRFEQDGLSHVAMQDKGLHMRGFPRRVRIDRNALRLPYDYRGVRAPSYSIADRVKMDIVLRQIQYAQWKLKAKNIRFVFVDDIYASRLADMFVSYPHLSPEGVIVHLMHYESFRDRRIGLERTRQIIPGVLFSPF